MIVIIVQSIIRFVSSGLNPGEVEMKHACPKIRPARRVVVRITYHINIKTSIFFQSVSVKQ